MRAVRYYGHHHVELVEVPKPAPGPGEVLVKVEYCGICGTDVHAYGMPGIFNWELILGHEGVGHVEEVGIRVEGLKKGDRVAFGPPGDCGMCYSCNTGNPNTCINGFPNTAGIGSGTSGAYAEYILSRFPKNELFKIPTGVSFEQAQLFDVLGVGFHAVRYSRMRLGDCVVVSGCGSIGLAVIQGARIGGASRLIALDPVESKRKLSMEAGADYAFDPTVPECLDTVRGLLNQAGGAQVCFEAAGSQGSLQNCVDLCMNSGQVVLVGNDGRPFPLVTAALGPRQLDLQFSFTYTKEEITMLFDMIESGKWSTRVYKQVKVPLTEAPRMLKALSEGEMADVCRILLVPNSSN